MLLQAHGLRRYRFVPYAAHASAWLDHFYVYELILEA